MAPSAKPADVGVTIGQVFLGKYRVDAILGHGGMGVVAECTHLALNERVAIKMLRPDVLLDHDAVERFTREGRAAAKLKSEYVARVTDVGYFESGVPYMVMEFLEGLDLGQLLEERGVLPVPWAVELMLQTAEALAEAHSLSIVHRDVKPSNLFVTWRPDGTALIKVLDFGISKSPMGTDMQLTQTQSLLGTPAYMSPEQMRSARLVDMRTDIWSLGTVMYELLEGRKPFEAESFSEMCVKVAVDPPTPMVRAPQPLQAVVLRCLAKAPEQRYANMAELGRDLIPFAQDPHQATMLVERMTRLLRRMAAGDFAIDTSAGGRTPLPITDAASGPAAAQRWGVGSNPVGTPWRDPSQPALPQISARALASEGSGGDAEPAVDTLHTAPRRKRWPLVAGVLAIAAALAAVFVFVASSHDNDTQAVQTPPPSAAALAPSSAGAAEGGTAVPAANSNAVTAPSNDTHTTTTPVTTTAPVGSSALQTGSGVSAPTVPHITAASSQPKHSTGKAKPPAHPSVTTTAPPIAATTKKPEDAKTTTTPTPAKPAAPTTEPKPNCDPFGDLHGRQCN